MLKPRPSGLGGLVNYNSKGLEGRHLCRSSGPMIWQRNFPRPHGLGLILTVLRTSIRTWFLASFFIENTLLSDEKAQGAAPWA